jgi:hypothetical protein
MSQSYAASRRRFLQGAAALPAAAAAAQPLLPTVPFAKTRVTRLIIGSNPLYGYSHFNAILNRCMQEWMTQDQRIKVLKRCEQVGINTWQVHYTSETMADFRRYRDEGGTMNLLILGHGEMMKDPSLIKEAAKLKPLGIAHHGNLTDDRFRAGQMDLVRDFYRRVQDAGILGGISTHNPAVVDFVEGKGWDNDYYMTCMYRVSRTVEETRKEFGEAPLGEPYFEKDPERMVKMIRQTKKTCFAFKLFGAGRTIHSTAAVERALRFALTNIKPGDAVIVGMWPKFKDEPLENASLVRKILAT